MVFSSLVFLFGFLPLFLAVYWLLPGLRTKNVWLTIASYVFYGWWRADFVLLMLFSTLLDWFCALRMGEPGSSPHRKRWVILSIVTNLALLGWFKYANFAVETLEGLGAGPFDWTEIVLPVGISFYTFQSMSYTIDVYRGEVKPVRSLLDLACFVSMFPQLVAGPIVRYVDMQEQLHKRSVTLAYVSDGLLLLMIGLVKKVLIADHAALIAEPVFAAQTTGLCDAWLGVFAYAVQIYFDFSGYSDMAVGLGLMIGLRMPINFDSPYRATSITEFWRRWHVSLSTWLRDYLYVPLGGNQRGRTRTYVNLMLTMLLGGLWHGAAWTFVIWGAYQGLFLVIERAFGKRPLWAFLPRPLQVAATFVVVLGGWAVFNARDVEGLASIWRGMAGLGGFGALPTPSAHATLAYLGVAIGAVIAFFGTHSWELVRRFRTRDVLCIALLFLLAIGQLAVRSHTPFLYFRF